MRRVGLIKTVALLGAVALGGFAARDAKAATIIFGAFTETGSPALTYNNTSGVLSGSNVTATFNDAGSGVLGNFSGPVTFNLSATRTAGVAGNAQINGSTVSQQVFGTLTFKSGATTVLNMTF